MKDAVELKTMRALVLSLLLPSLAFGAEPDVQVAADGSVIARILVSAPEARIRAVIPELQGEGVNSNVLGVRRTSEGACESIRRTTRGLYRPLELHTRFCPTATGWRERLVAAGDFTAYEADWTLRPMADGQTGVELRVLSEVNLMVPQGLLQSGTVAGVKETLRALLSRLVKP